VRTGPLYALLKAKRVFEWGEKEERSFQALKEAVRNMVELFIPDPARPFEIFVDACESTETLGAALMQEDPEIGYLCPCAFTSRRMSPAELKYHIREKEFLGCVFAVKTWRPYVSHTTKVWSDYESLKYVNVSADRTLMSPPSDFLLD